MKLAKEENKSRLLYRRLADKSYEGIAEFVKVLNSNDKFVNAKEKLKSVSAIISSNSDIDKVSAVKEVEDVFKDIDGADKIKGKLSKIRREFKKKDPNLDKIEDNFEQAINLYAEQEFWRPLAYDNLGKNLSDYLILIEDNLGVRQMTKLPREVALYVASCRAHHEDISVNF